ncbi:MAG: hypothetical protein GKS05_05210 [Nitrospirales bacterium]|nr:hypothetical protein [Nitrospirales bacterium]
MDRPIQSNETTCREIVRVWEAHKLAVWPTSLGALEGQLMMLDTVIAGCATYFLESEDGLDPQRVDMLQETQNDLHLLQSDLPDDAAGYVQRLDHLCTLLLHKSQST